MTQGQDGLFRGLYQFEDPSGSIMAARMPVAGAADLYDGTQVLVRPNQAAIMVYKGQYADLLTSGLKSLKTENIPLLTRLANWRLGFESPLLAEIWFFSLNQFTGRRWGTLQPVIVTVDQQPIGLRVYGNYSLRILNPRRLHSIMIGSRSLFSIADAEEYIQGEILEKLPNALMNIKTLAEISSSQDRVSESLQASVNLALENSGLEISNLQILSIAPSKEVQSAIDARTSMSLIGNQKDYLLYNTAQGIRNGTSANPMEIMMSLMLSKGLPGNDYHQKEKAAAATPAVSEQKLCLKCSGVISLNSKFCSSCGEKV